MWQVRADGHLPCVLITFGARLAASEIAFSNLLDMRFRFTLFPFPLAVSVHTQQVEERQRVSEREGRKVFVAIAIYACQIFMHSHAT